MEAQRHLPRLWDAAAAVLRMPAAPACRTVTPRRTLWPARLSRRAARNGPARLSRVDDDPVRPDPHDDALLGRPGAERLPCVLDRQLVDELSRRIIGDSGGAAYLRVGVRICRVEDQDA